VRTNTPRKWKSVQVKPGAMGESDFHGLQGIYFGIMLALTGKMSASLGLIVKKVSHNEELAKDEKEQTSMLCRWKWWVGVVLLAALPGVCDGWALMYAPLSIVAPIAGTTIVFNTILAVWFLEEKTSMMETLATVIILGGVCLTSIFGSRHTEEYSAAELVDLFQCTPMYVYYVVIGLDLAASTIVTQTCKHNPGLHAFAFANIAGCLGGQQNLFLKGLAELLFKTFDGDSQFHEFATYVFFIGFPVLAISQMLVLNMGLAQHDAISYIPMYQAAFAMYGAIAGGVYFREWYEMTLFKAIMFILGLVCVLFGLVLIGRVDHSHKASLKSSSEDEEELSVVMDEDIIPTSPTPLMIDVEDPSPKDGVGVGGSEVYVNPLTSNAVKAGDPVPTTTGNEMPVFGDAEPTGDACLRGC